MMGGIMDEQDIRSAGNTPVDNVLSELRERSGILKTSVIIVGTLLNKVKQEKLYKEFGNTSFNAFVNSIGLSVEMSLSLMQITDTLATRFPEAYASLEGGMDYAYLPSRKAMVIASKLDEGALTEVAKQEFTSPTGVKKLKRHAEPDDKIDQAEGLPISKVAKSSKIFTKKVMNCDDLPEATKSEMAGVNQKIQDLSKEDTDEI
jgi:hypothetical protein